MSSEIRLKADLVLAGPRLEAISNGAVLMAGGRIVAVGEDRNVPVPDACEPYDFGPATLMPGMIDAHMHTFGVDSTQLHLLGTESKGYRTARALSELRRLLQAGFTSARCMGSTVGPDVRRAIDEGLAEGPRMKVAGGFISSTSGTWDDRLVDLSRGRLAGELADGRDGLVRAVRQRVREGVDFIKLGLSKGGAGDRYHAWGDDPLQQVVTFSLEEVKAAVEEAHRNGLRVSAHAIGEEAVKLALDGGIDTIEHGYGISPETRARIVKSGKIVVSTISQLHFHRAAYDRFHYPRWERDVYDRHWAIMERDFKLGLEAGVRFALGTDLIGGPTHPLDGAAAEFRLAAEWGMSKHAALVAGTRVAAEAIGIAEDTGTLEIGKVADLVSVVGNPIEDIRSLEHLQVVVKEGRIVRDPQPKQTRAPV